MSVGGRPAQLSGAEYRLLFELSANAGRLLTSDQLLRRVWPLRGAGDTQVLRAYVRRLRRKLGDDANSPKYIFNESSRRVPHGEGGGAGAGEGVTEWKAGDGVTAKLL